MEIVLGIVMSSREFPTFCFSSEAVDTFRGLLTNGLLGFKTDLVETIAVTLHCLSPQFSKFFKIQRPKYYADKIVKCRGSVTPEVRMYKCLTADFVVDFEFYRKLTTKEECLHYLALSFIDFLKTLKYPGALKKFEKEKLLQAVRDVFIEKSILSEHEEL